MNWKTTLLAGLLAMGAMLPCHAQVTVVKHGKAKSSIILTTDQQADKDAAVLLQDFIRRISGAELQIEQGGKIKKGDILIGNGGGNQAYITDQLSEDGFLITTEGGIGRIVSGGDKGSIYGVVALLEQQLGVNYWGEQEYSLQQQQTIELPAFTTLENPAFRYRQSQNYALGSDPIYKIWMRLEEPKDVFAGGYWVHTFDKLLPSAVYGEKHPEYYSFFKGKRNPGKASQWCLTNPEVFEIVSQQVDSIFKVDPDKHIISVSQNDGNFTNCTCPECKEIDDREGTPAGSMVYFMNKLAERFPDKEFSMLAYLYTMNPPKYIRPLPNVNIMLCNIDCNREVTLTENASGQYFMKAMEGWSKITNNIFQWDYGINFDNYLAPFPNFHILQDNIKLFKQHGVTMHFSQIASVRGGDFAEMRTWMVSKLMWNPEADCDSLVQVFLNGYYGEAGPYLYQYNKLQEGALLGSGLRLWIYDSPVSHKDGMLKPELLRRYGKLFDLAEAAVDGDEVYLNRVRRSRLSIQFSELDIARTYPERDLGEINTKLDLFEARANQFGATKLNERNNSPQVYCQLYRERYMPRTTKSLAAGAKVTYLTPPAPRYAKLAETALTDELFGGPGFVESWVGWDGCDAAFVIDLGEEKEISVIDADFLHQLGHWVLLPKQVTYLLSNDGQNFREVGKYDIPEDKDPTNKFVSVVHRENKPVKTRYIKVDVAGTNICPEWHYGVGHNCWFFVDEVTVL